VSYAFASLHSRPRREPSVMGLVTCFFLLPRHCFTNYKLPLGVLPRRAGCFNCLKRRFNQLSIRSELMTLVVSELPVISLKYLYLEISDSIRVPVGEVVRAFLLKVNIQYFIFRFDLTLRVALKSKLKCCFFNKLTSKSISNSNL
jgi:hypothetical protein